MAVGAERDSVFGIEDQGQQFIHASDVVNVQGVRPTTLLGLNAARLAREVIPMEHIGTEVIVQGRVSDHHADGLNSASIVRVPVTGVPSLLEFPVALAATRNADLCVRGRLGEFFAADLTRDDDLLGLSLATAGSTAVHRNSRTTLVEEVRLEESDRVSADLTGMLASVCLDPQTGGARAITVRTHTAYSTAQA